MSGCSAAEQAFDSASGAALCAYAAQVDAKIELLTDPGMAKLQADKARGQVEALLVVARSLAAAANVAAPSVGAQLEAATANLESAIAAVPPEAADALAAEAFAVAAGQFAEESAATNADLGC